MYARRFQVDILAGGERRPCPREWLDQFAMRDFTGSARYDDTLPLADGLIEAGFRVDPGAFAGDFAAWLTRRGKGHGQPVDVRITEIPRSAAAPEEQRTA